MTAVLTDESPIVMEQTEEPPPCDIHYVPICRTEEQHAAQWCALWSCGCSAFYCDKAEVFWRTESWRRLGYTCVDCRMCGVSPVSYVMGVPL